MPGPTTLPVVRMLLDASEGWLRTAIGLAHINLVQSGRVKRTGHKAATRYWPASSS
jgi:hypothetical protein